MPHVEARVYATLRQFLPPGVTGDQVSLDVAPGSTVASLVAQLGIPAAEVKVVFVNHRAVPADRLLEEADRVGIFPLVAGG